MKIADFFVQLGVVGDTKELDKTINQMEKANKRNKDILKYRKELAKATTAEEKATIKKNFADKIKLENLKKEKAGIEANKNAFLGAAKGIGAFIGAATIAYKVVDHMVNSLARANQQLIGFQRQTGISFASLNKYASANAAVNYNSTIEGTAQSMQRVAQNLWDIRMGRGDISPYQELAYVGGKAFNPMGMSVEQVIESVREAIKGVDDLQATNIITRMGFSPDDLLMLRMSREEFEKINSMFLNKEQREAMNQYALQMKQIQLQFNLLKEKSLLKIMPAFVKLSQWLTNTIQLWAEFANNIINAVKASERLQFAIKAIGIAIAVGFAWINPLIAGLTMLYLIIEDIAGYFMGYKSVTGFAVNHLIDFFDELGEKIGNSKIAQFFNEFKQGMKELTNIHLPNWLIGMLTGNWALAGIEFFKYINEIKAVPDFSPSTNNSNITNNTNNDNNVGISIYTTQAIDSVLRGLAATNPAFVPASIFYTYGIRQ